MSKSSLAPRLCCLDLDTFFVSVERLFDPKLVGKPVVVGALPGQRGVVTAASYEVRMYGVRSGMAIAEAVRRAPRAIYLPTRHDTYGKFSRQVRAVIDRFCPVIQAASIDEFFMDFTGCEPMYRRPGEQDGDTVIERTVREMREAIQQEVGLPASAGIGTTRAVAKMASGRAKPAGVLLVPAGREQQFASPLPVRKFPGIGPVAESKLVESGLRTLGELLALRPGQRGRQIEALRQLVLQGLSEPCLLEPKDRPAFREHDEPGEALGSISSERTFPQDEDRVQPIEDELRALVERVVWRVRQRGILARTVTLKLRTADFRTLTRSKTLPATCEERALLDAVLELLHGVWAPPQPLRLLGVALSRLETPPAQLELAFDREPRPPAGRAIDAVRARFGYDSIRLGSGNDGRRWLE